jgi:hypothetical protein
MFQQCVRIMLILGMIAVMCGTVGAAASIGATNEHPGVGSPNVCTAPCECISMNEAAQRWGAEGYEMCSKSICGQSADAMTQYYCIHPIGGSSAPAVTTCQAPCECLSDAGARLRWGANGYTQCSKTTCGQETTNSGTVARYCYRQFGSTLLIGGAATTAATAVPAATTPATVQVPAQTQVQTLVQTQAQATVNPAPATTWQTPYPIQTKSPVGIATILAAIGLILLAFVVMRKE